MDNKATGRLSRRAFLAHAGAVSAMAFQRAHAQGQANRAAPNERLNVATVGAGGQAADIRIEAREILKIRNRINALLAAETGQPEDKVARDSDRNFWMTAEEALEYNLINKIITRVDEIG